jgi:5-formyltetrahydrofolate cyclo-ligase
MDKQALRSHILEKRGNLSEEELNTLSGRILEQLRLSRLLEAAETVMIFMDFKDEVRTAGIIEHLWQAGKTAVIPKVNRKADRLDLYSIRSFEDMVRSSYGILEPPKDRTPDVQPEALDLILSPGVVFDVLGNRIGYGAGYYDKLLPHTRPDCVVCGLAFELQVVENDMIPVESHDIPLDYLVTDTRVIRTPHGELKNC